MPKFNREEILNILFLGHNSSGKTMLAEQILYAAKAIQSVGNVKEGTSAICTDPEEKERETTLLLNIAFGEYNNKLLNIYDAPGYLELSGQVLTGIHACDLAIICVDATAGATVSTKKFYDYARQYRLPCIIALNKLDATDKTYDELIKGLKEAIAENCTPVLFPDNVGGSFTKVYSILDDESSLPEEIKKSIPEHTEKIIEADDSLLEKYLEGSKVSSDELKSALSQALEKDTITAVVPASALKGTGIKELATFITNAAKPKQIPQSLNEVIEKSSGLVARVFKCNSDRFVGKIVFLKVYKGTLKQGDSIYNIRTEKSYKASSIFKPFGNEQKSISEVGEGDIIAITKIEDLSISDVVTSNPVQAEVEPLEFPRPVISVAVEPKAKKDETKLSSSLQKMKDADPTLAVIRDPKTHELVLSGLGQLHLEVTLSRMKKIFGTEVRTKPPKIPFNETVIGQAEGHHKHKKQSGGRGQFGEVYLKVEPSGRGEGLVFVNAITQGKIPSQYIPSIEKGIKNTMEKGIIAGYPIVDTKVTVYDGSFHDVDSDNNSFEIAGSKAFKDGFLKAKPAILEPIVNMDVVIPTKFLGDIQGQIVQKRGRIQTVDSQGNLQVIKAQVPLMEALTYATELNSVTAGEGTFTMELSHYDVLPAQIAEKIKAQAQKEKEEED